jgi:leucyl/phenylalanyl-tRNA--protein transferase
MTARAGEIELTPDLLLAAYREGYFPMAESRTGPIFWYSPDPRAIIPLEQFQSSRSLRQVLKKKLFTITVNVSFQEVIAACASRAETWISDEIVEVYTALHRMGYAHSVESWRDGRLSGGLYGVAIGGAFFGESMFSHEPNSSKVALAMLVDRLRDRGFILLDAQIMTEHLRQFGTQEIPRGKYLQILRKALQINAEFDEPAPHGSGL